MGLQHETDYQIHEALIDDLEETVNTVQDNLIKMELRFNEQNAKIIKLERELNVAKLCKTVLYTQEQIDALVVYIGDEIDYRVEAAKPLHEYDADKTMACENEMQESYLKFFDLFAKPEEV